MHKKERDRENLRVRERNEPNAQSAKQAILGLNKGGKKFEYTKS